MMKSATPVKQNQGTTARKQKIFWQSQNVGS